MALIATAIVTLDEAKRAAKSGAALTSDETAVLESIVNGVTVAFESEIHRSIKSREKTVVVTGQGGRRLYLDDFPAISVTTLQVLAFDGSVFKTYAAQDYYLDGARGVIYLRTDLFPGPPCDGGTEFNVSVTYVAGWATVPDDLKLAALWWISRLFHDFTTGREDIDSISLNGQTTTYPVEDIPKKVKARLSPYILDGSAG